MITIPITASSFHDLNLGWKNDSVSSTITPIQLSILTKIISGDLLFVSFGSIVSTVAYPNAYSAIPSKIKNSAID